MREMMFIAIGIITSLIATYGKESIAGFGIASRVEMFAMLVIGALSTIFAPILGQNIGARKATRVSEIIKESEKFSLFYGLVVMIILFFTGEGIASIFTDNQEAINTISLYLKIIPLSYGIQGLFLIYTGALNVLNRPVISSLISLIRLFALYIPLAVVGSKFFGLLGIWAALVISFVIITFVAKKILRTALTDVLS